MTAAVLALLDEVGLVPISDRRLPSVASLVAGAPIAGSWWGHPAGHAIYAMCEELGDRSDVVLVKLVERKLTYVHGRLWPALLGVAQGREPWQLRGLSEESRALLAEVDDAGQVVLERRGGAALRGLEERLLVHTWSRHTERGSHAKVLEAWGAWAARVGFDGPRLAPAEGRAVLEEAAARLASWRSAAQ